jgi:hypothetical protein
MIHKLRTVCPACLICLAVLVFSVFGMDSLAASVDGQSDEEDAAVTYTADSWSNSGMAVPVTAQDSAAAVTDATDSTAGSTLTYETETASHTTGGCDLSDADRIRVECVVMCEAGGEGEKGQMMVAQCILDGMERFGYSVEEYISQYKVMTTSYSNVTDEVRESVSKVFDDGQRVTDKKADLWYNPAITASYWHEAQQYVITVGSHRFFWMLDSSAA